MSSIRHIFQSTALVLWSLTGPMFQTSWLRDCDAVSKSDIGRREKEREMGREGRVSRAERERGKVGSCCQRRWPVRVSSQPRPGPELRVCFPRDRRTGSGMFYISFHHRALAITDHSLGADVLIVNPAEFMGKFGRRIIQFISESGQIPKFSHWPFVSCMQA